MNRIIINGKEINCSGNNISICNNHIVVDGEEILTNVKTKDKNIYIYGDVENIKCEGSVNCDNVNGEINAGGSVNCDNVEGNITCGGSVNCDKITGDIKAGGNIVM